MTPSTHLFEAPRRAAARPSPKRRPSRRARTAPGLVIDLYAGGGGASEGIRRALGRGPNVAVNHNRAAIYMHWENHPDTIHLETDVDLVDPTQYRGMLRLLWASPQCTHHSRARGKAPKSLQQREQGWSVVRWARLALPDVICCENVGEWLSWGPLHPDDHPNKKLRGQPIKERAGETWNAWVQALRDLGYEVAWSMLVACKYGAPTSRDRLFVVARRDGGPMVFPVPTHGAPESAGVKLGNRLPYRVAAECIDFTLPMCSIFATPEEAKAWRKANKADGTPQRPLADATMARIAEGIKRFVLGKRRPFLVNTVSGAAAPIVAKAHANGSDRPGSGVRSGGDPIGTLTATEQFAVAAASLTVMHGRSVGSGLDAPAPTIATHAHDGMVAAHLLRTDNQSDGHLRGLAHPDEPLRTITTTGGHAVAAASLLNLSHGGRPEDIEQPANTLTATPIGGDRCLITAGLIETGNGERKGQAPRVRDIERPFGTVTALGSQGAIAAAWCIKNYGGPNGHPTPGSSVADPCPTISGRDSSAVGATFLEKLHGSARAGQPVDEPAPTIAAGGNRGGGHAAVVSVELSRNVVKRARAVCRFLTLYYSGGGTSAAVDAPAPTIPTKDRLGLVTVVLETCDGPAEVATVEIDGVTWIIVDICMRMLTPEELKLCQGFPKSYILRGTKAEKIARIGNSVSPQPAEALIRALFPDEAAPVDDAMAAK